MAATIKRFVVEITMVIDDAGTQQTFLFSTSPFATKPTDVPPSTPVYGYLDNPGTFKQELFSGARVTGAITPSFGGITLSNHAPEDGGPGVLDEWVNYGISGGRVVVRWGPEGGAYPSEYSTVYIGYARTPRIGLDKVVVPLTDGSFVLDQPVVTEGFAGSGGLEGYGAVAKPKQFVSGDPGFIPPILVDSVRQIYFVQSTGTDSADSWQYQPNAELNPFDVFELGQKINRVSPNYSSAAEVVSTQPAPGTVRYWFGSSSTILPGWKNGPVYFRLGTPPIGELRVYPQGRPSDPDFARAGSASGSFSFASMALRAGVTQDRIANGFTSIGSALVDDATTYADLMSKCARETQAWFGFNRQDKFRSGYLADPNDEGLYYGINSGVLSSNPALPTISLYTFTEDRYETLRREPVAGMEAPVWSLFVKARKTWPCPVSDAAPDNLKDYLTRDPWWATFQGVSDTCKTANPGAIVETLEVENADFPNAFSRRLFLERYFALFGGRRDVFILRAKMTDALLALELHDVVTLQTPRFGLSAGRKFRIISIDIDCRSEVPSITFGLWGGSLGQFTGTVSLVSNVGAPATPTAVRSIGKRRFPAFTRRSIGTVQSAQGGLTRRVIPALTRTVTGSVETIAPDPQFANVVLLVRGTSGFADLSSNAISPTTIGSPTSSTQSGWHNPSVLRFVRSGTSAVTYSKPGGFLSASSDDLTVEMFVQIDNLTYAFGTFTDNRASFLRFTDGGTMRFRFFVHGGQVSADYLGVASPGNNTTANVGLTGRVHLAYCRAASPASGNKEQVWVNGSRVVALTGVTNWNFDLVQFGVSVINGSNNDAQGYAEELRITKGARYDGATITVPTTLFPPY